MTVVSDVNRAHAGCGQQAGQWRAEATRAAHADAGVFQRA